MADARWSVVDTSWLAYLYVLSTSCTHRSSCFISRGASATTAPVAAHATHTMPTASLGTVAVLAYVLALVPGPYVARAVASSGIYEGELRRSCWLVLCCNALGTRPVQRGNDVIR
jgi:hypothetical protein